MKKTGFWLALLTVVALSFSGCEKVKQALTFDLDYSTDITIPSTIGLNVPLSIPTPDVESGAEQKFETEGTRTDLVKEISLKSASLQIISPTGKTFSFLKDIEVFINADGLAEMLLASRTNIDNNVGSSLPLDTITDFLDPYVKQEAFSLRTRVVTDEALLQDVTIRVDLVFQVVADPL